MIIQSRTGVSHSEIFTENLLNHMWSDQLDTFISGLMSNGLHCCEDYLVDGIKFFLMRLEYHMDTKGGHLPGWV